MSGKGFASAEAKPLLPKARCMGKIKIPKSKKSPSGKQFAPDGIFIMPSHSPN